MAGSTSEEMDALVLEDEQRLRESGVGPRLDRPSSSPAPGDASAERFAAFGSFPEPKERDLMPSFPPPARVPRDVGPIPPSSDRPPAAEEEEQSELRGSSLSPPPPSPTVRLVLVGASLLLVLLAAGALLFEYVGWR